MSVTISTNVPPLVWTAEGWQAPLDDAILSGTQADINGAFGGVLNFTTAGGSVTNPTPQGQLAEAWAATVSANYDLVMLMTSLVDPALSVGRMHSAIGRIYFIEKIAASASTVWVTCIGAGGTTVPSGAQVEDINGNIWQCLNGGTIDNSGSLLLQFNCTVDGPIPCPAGALNVANGAQFITSVGGWDTFSNASAATFGTSEETDQAFEQRRSLSTALNSRSWTQAMLATLLTGVPNVVDAYVVENLSTTSQTIMGVSMLPTSALIAVVGGAAADIANALFIKHPPGVIWNGNTTYTVYDTQQGYSAPYPAYQMQWETPVPLPFVVNVSFKNLPNVPSNALTLVQNAVVAAFSGADQQGYDQNGNPVYGPRVRWPSVFAERFAASVANLWPGAQLVDIFIGSPNSPAASLTGAINGNTLSVTSVLSGTIAIGQVIDDLTGQILPGTTIVSGSGMSWQVSAAQTVTTETIYGIVPTLKEVDITLAQYPAIAAGNVSVTLV